MNLGAQECPLRRRLQARFAISWKSVNEPMWNSRQREWKQSLLGIDLDLTITILVSEHRPKNLAAMERLAEMHFLWQEEARNATDRVEASILSDQTVGISSKKPGNAVVFFHRRPSLRESKRTQIRLRR